jgi:hypothetical protein
MGGEKALLWGICLVMMLFVVVAVVDYIVIIHTKMDFDFYCRQVFWQCEQNVGLTREESDLIVEELKEKGYEDVTVTAPLRGTISRGDKIEFSIKANKEMMQRQGIYIFERVDMPFEYSQIAISRRLVN